MILGFLKIRNQHLKRTTGKGNAELSPKNGFDPMKKKKDEDDAYQRCGITLAKWLFICSREKSVATLIFSAALVISSSSASIA